MIGLAAKLLSLLSLIKFGEIFLSLGSIVLSIGTYAMLFGWQYAVGFVALIFLHEAGHYLAAQQKNLNVGLPTFIPFVGAWIQLKEMPMSAEVEAYVAYAGPLVGTLAAFAFYFYGVHVNSSLFLALAQTGFIINLFNLIPLSPLDGGRITAIISPKVWFIGAPLLVGLWFYSFNPLLILIALLSIPQLKKAWRFDPTAAENKAYYMINNTVRFEYAVLYLGLTIVLISMITYR